MAIDTKAEATEIGIEIRNRITRGLTTGMARRIAFYRNYLALGNNVDAVDMVKAAIDKPFKARAWVDRFIVTYGQQDLDDALAEIGTTYAELDAFIALHETYAQGLFDRRQLGEDWELLAQDIEANYTDKTPKWGNFSKAVVGRKDIWGSQG